MEAKASEAITDFKKLGAQFAKNSQNPPNYSAENQDGLKIKIESAADDAIKRILLEFPSDCRSAELKSFLECAFCLALGSGSTGSPQSFADFVFEKLDIPENVQETRDGFNLDMDVTMSTTLIKIW